MPNGTFLSNPALTTVQLVTQFNKKWDGGGKNQTLSHNHILFFHRSLNNASLQHPKSWVISMRLELAKLFKPSFIHLFDHSHASPETSSDVFCGIFGRAIMRKSIAYKK
ncbi:hypothetical protein AVEN_154063-1 [Araneus ventricosus]|uniref:Uncharacterized protein n=1 Tax=Araneus ventricosus TaxID=182803 RepID=A0A4Y2IYQ9_ARAVE|nr:hypothetical protein AVEN_154063-1 [Araneus ventricosus]